jgi:hypothetical protein
MTTAQIIWAVLIVAQAIVATPIVLTLIKGDSEMPLSDAFNAALTNLTAAYTAEVTAKQTALDAANAQVTALQGAANQVDAEATAAIIAATPAAQ